MARPQPIKAKAMGMPKAIKPSKELIKMRIVMVVFFL
jgi:hypothetical protein